MIKRFFPHITAILSLLVLTLFTIHRFNEMMGFMTATISQYAIGLTALCAFVLAVADIVENLKTERRRYEKRMRAREQQRRERAERED